jgi:hypothetical protein
LSNEIIKSEEIIIKTKKTKKHTQRIAFHWCACGNDCCRLTHCNTCKQDVGVVGEEDVDVHAAGFESRCWQDFAAAATLRTAAPEKDISTDPSRTAASSRNLLLLLLLLPPPPPPLLGEAPLPCSTPLFI